MHLLFVLFVWRLLKSNKFFASHISPLHKMQTRERGTRSSFDATGSKKLKARCVSSSSSHSFVVLFNPPREGERKREKERESARRLCSLFFVLRSTTILSFPRKSFLLSLLLCLLLSKRAQTERDARERERIIDS